MPKHTKKVLVYLVQAARPLVFRHIGFPEAGCKYPRG